MGANRSILGRDDEGRTIDIEIEGSSGIITTDDGGGSEHPDKATHVALGLADDAHTHAAGDHPNLATHDALGLATDAELTTHAATAHGTSAHAISGVLHTGSLDHSALGTVTANQHHNQAHALGGADHSGSLAQSSVTNLESALAGKAALSHSHVDADIPAAIARDTEVTTAISDHLAAATHGGDSGGPRFKVGDIYFTTTNYADAAAVATAEGYGSWVRFGVGRFLLLTDDTANQTGGSATHSHAFTPPNAHTDVPTHTHTTDSQGAHTHSQSVNSATTGGLSGYTPDTSTNTSTTSGYSTGSGGAHPHTAATPAGAVASQPHTGGAVTDGSTDPLSITAYAWLRTA